MNLYYAFAALAVAPSALSQVQLVSYATNNFASLTPAASNAVINAGNVVSGSAIDLVSPSSTFNFRSWGATNFADAVAGNEFWRWGFSVADPTKLIDLTELKLRLDRSGTGPTDFEILVEVFSDTTLTAPAVSSVVIQGSDPGTSGSDFTFDLTALTLPTLGGSNAVQFTLAAFGASSTLGTFDLEKLLSTSTTSALIISGVIDIVSEAPSGSPSATPSATPSETPSASPSQAPSESPSSMPSEKEFCDCAGGFFCILICLLLKILQALFGG